VNRPHHVSYRLNQRAAGAQRPIHHGNNGLRWRTLFITLLPFGEGEG
jgi:hypothetical protein